MSSTLLTTDLRATQPPAEVKGTALWAYGFRPFFLLAALQALLWVPAWAILFPLGKNISPYYPSIFWHAHEMLFGFVVAGIAGFLLTATGTWTGRPMPKGAVLAGLAVLWSLARLLPFFPLPGIVTTLVDFLFLPLLLALLAGPIIKAGKPRNYFVLPCLALLAVANGLFHLGLLGHIAGGLQTGIDLGLLAVLLIIVILTGRLMPFFTRARLGSTPFTHPALETAAILSTV